MATSFKLVWVASLAAAIAESVVGRLPPKPPVEEADARAARP